MLRIVRLLGYGLLGYVLYELYQGLAAQERLQQEPQSGDLERALDEEPGRMNMSGPGRGMRVPIEEESTGVAGSEIVGRGVTR